MQRSVELQAEHESNDARRSVVKFRSVLVGSCVFVVFLDQVISRILYAAFG
jgi:hypothetical protein